VIRRNEKSSKNKSYCKHRGQQRPIPWRLRARPKGEGDAKWDQRKLLKIREPDHSGETEAGKTTWEKKALADGKINTKALVGEI